MAQLGAAGPPHVPRKLGFWMCLALVVGNIIGSGVYLLPASLALLGRNVLMGWLATALGAIALGIVFTALSRELKGNGGPYAATRAAFGPLAGFVIAWGYWVSIWVGNVTIATGAVSYTSTLVPWIANVPGASALVTVAVVWLLHPRQLLRGPGRGLGPVGDHGRSSACRSWRSRWRRSCAFGPSG